MSQELDWELADIFDSGIFVFPVDECSDARRVVRYLLMRGILAEEVASAIEQPGSTTDLIAWLAGDERKTMVGVWAMAWLNDARRRYERSRTIQRRVDDFRIRRRDDVSPTPRRQMSLDSDFGGSGDSAAGSRKGSIGDGLSTDCSEDLRDDDVDDDVSVVSDVGRRRWSRQDGGHHATTSGRCKDAVSCLADEDAAVMSRCSGAGRSGSADFYCDRLVAGRPRSEMFSLDDEEFFAVGVDACDSGNFSDVCASFCALDTTYPTGPESPKLCVLSCGEDCQCTLAHYTTSTTTNSTQTMTSFFSGPASRASYITTSPQPQSQQA